MDSHLYHYQAEVDRVIDGDTVVLRIDLGFRTATTPISCRLTGIQAPEKRTLDTEEKLRGIASLAHLVDLLAFADELVVRSDRLDKYGRPLVTIFAKRDDAWVDVNATMIADGFATPYIE